MMKPFLKIVLLIVLFTAILPVYAIPPNTTNADTTDHLVAGWMSYWQGDYQTALAHFDAVIETAPNWSEGYVGRVKVYMEQENHEAVIENVSAAFAHAQFTDVSLLKQRAFAYMRTGNYEAALEDLDLLVGDIVNDYELYAYQGEAMLALGNTEGAKAAYLNAIIANPSYLEGYAKLAELNTGHHCVSSFNSYMRDGLIAYSEHRYDDAMIAFETAARVFTRSHGELAALELGLAQYQMARVLLAQGQREAAHDLLGTAAENAPQVGKIYSVMACTCQNAMHRMEILNTGIEQAPYYASNYLGRGFFHEQQGNLTLSGPDLYRWLLYSHTRTIEWELDSEENTTMTLPFFKGWQYTISFEADAEQVLDVTTLSTLNAVDSLLVLVDENANVVAARDDLETYHAGFSHIELQEAGRYMLLIGHAGGASEGLLEVNISLR